VTGLSLFGLQLPRIQFIMLSIQGFPEEKGLKPQHVKRLKQLIDTMVGLIENQFTGSLKINFSQGSIGRVEKFEEILKK
jgi:hypothetical protein